MWHICGRKEMHAGFVGENLKKRDHFANLCTCQGIIENEIPRK